MSFSLRRASDPDVTIATCEGSLDINDAKAGAKAIWSTPAFRANPVILDFRQARLSVSAADVRALAEFILTEQPAASRPPRIALVAPGDLDFGLSRVFAAYRDHPSTEVGVFRDFDEALIWAQSAGTKSPRGNVER
jgi:hypothetical protein